MGATKQHSDNAEMGFRGWGFPPEQGMDILQLQLIILVLGIPPIWYRIIMSLQKLTSLN
jgi:hypothetical protein